MELDCSKDPRSHRHIGHITQPSVDGGKPAVKIDASAHTNGVPQGNATGNYEK